MEYIKKVTKMLIRLGDWVKVQNFQEIQIFETCSITTNIYNFKF